ncbi:MAG: hypothetical protein WDN69_14295 [Aliidongia sp.]
MGLQLLDIDPGAKAAACGSDQYAAHGLVAAGILDQLGQRVPGRGVEGVDRRMVEHDLGDAVGDL